ncbi:hypothetical protein chiPu_0009000 [Chiloscyllium punctatum]|uniref:Uncharacterized protein n=1 Tax=Chiloscyllium punctatum TaxID=137246 RepID=A0A401SJF0_CHIPU|nr:hypothetical protein [Chiloscyllium punctatum]
MDPPPNSDLQRRLPAPKRREQDQEEENVFVSLASKRSSGEEGGRGPISDARPRPSPGATPGEVGSNRAGSYRCLDRFDARSEREPASEMTRAR